MSTNPRIYLDFNATAPLLPAVRLAISDALGVVGNPSSIHAEGRAARDLVERSRNHVAALVGRPREEVVFTSGGTEANLLGVSRLAAAAITRGLPRVVATTAIEHPSLRGAVARLAREGWQVRLVTRWTEAPDAGLFALAAANHELGTLAELAGLDRAPGLVHIDAVQVGGKRRFDDITAVADAIAVSAHKLGGPPGTGALVTRVDDAATHENLADTDEAGHQERGRRPGTENVLGIVGMGAAAAAADPDAWGSVALLGDRLEAGLRALDAVRIHGAGEPRIGGTINAGFAGALGESIVVALDLAGIATSTGAACTSGSVKPSPVLRAIGFTDAEAKEAVRFSLGRTTTAEEIDEVLGVLPAIVKRARDRRP